MMSEKPTKKLSDNQNKCRNCDTEFSGKYCPECGQTIKHFDKPFKFFIVDFMGNIFAFDTRLWKTFKAVLFKPGKMTLDFMNGKRVRYMPPFRFYIFVSFIFFLLLNFQIKKQILNKESNIDSLENRKAEINVPGIGIETDTNSNIVNFNNLPEEQADRIDSITDELSKKLKKSVLYEDSVKKENRIKEISEEKNIDIEHIIQHPEIYVERFFKFASWSLFLLMPVFALFLLLFFRKTYKFYIAHLVFALNQHAFLFFIMTIVIVVKMIFPEKNINPENYLLFFPPVFLFIGSKRLYKRNWIRTFFSLLLILFLYVLVMLPVVSVISLLALNLI